jgi:hypothetical protein
MGKTFLRQPSNRILRSNIDPQKPKKKGRGKAQWQEEGPKAVVGAVPTW